VRVKVASLATTLTGTVVMSEQQLNGLPGSIIFQSNNTPVNGLFGFSSAIMRKVLSSSITISVQLPVAGLPTKPANEEIVGVIPQLAVITPIGAKVLV